MGTQTNYFGSCTTIEEIKKRYRELALQNHPDKGGNTEVMKVINSQYEKFRYQKFTATNHETQETYEQEFNPDDGYRNIIDKLVNLAGITIELCGSWLWITGDTKTHKDILKELNFKWSGKKFAWYWKPGDAKYRKKSKKELDLDQIRNLYGSEKIHKTREQEQQKTAIA